MLNNKLEKVPKIILVDPDIKRANIIREFFQNRKIAEIIYSTFTGTDAAEFLNKSMITSSEICAVLINIDTPSVNEAFRDIKNNFLFKNTPLIIFSNDEKKYIDDKNDFPVNVFFLKPMDLLSCEKVIHYLNWYELNICS